MSAAKGSPKPPGADSTAWVMLPDQVIGQDAPSACRAADREEIILTAFGFTLGFGWLWFPFLSTHWLPAFLWGGPFTGGGASLFIALLTGGFILYGLISIPKNGASPSAPPLPDGGAPPQKKRPGKALRLTGSHQAHAVVILIAALDLPSLLSIWESPPCLRVAALAAAALAMGIFWGGRLLSLPPRQAGWAIAAACVTGLVTAISLPICPFASHGLCLALSLTLAWLAAWRLEHLKKKVRPEPRRPRGRPPKKTIQVASENLSAPPLAKSDAALAVTAFFLMGLTRVGPGGSPATIWPAQFMAIIGTVGGMFLFWAATKDKARSIGFIQELNPDQPQVPLCLSLACQGVGQLLAPELFYLPAQLLMGVACLTTTLLLAGTPLRTAQRRAALVLALALILSNLGTEMAALLARTINSTSSMWSLASEPAARLTGLATLLAALAFWAIAASAPPERQEASPKPEPERRPTEADAPPPTPAPNKEAGQAGINLADTDPGLTAREEEIMRMVIRGCGNRQIAERLEIQEVTVRFHLRNIYKKTGLQNRKSLVALADQLEQRQGAG